MTSQENNPKTILSTKLKTILGVSVLAILLVLGLYGIIPSFSKLFTYYALLIFICPCVMVIVDTYFSKFFHPLYSLVTPLLVFLGALALSVFFLVLMIMSQAVVAIIIYSSMMVALLGLLTWYAIKRYKKISKYYYDNIKQINFHENKQYRVFLNENRKLNITNTVFNLVIFSVFLGLCIRAIPSAGSSMIGLILTFVLLGYFIIDIFFWKHIPYLVNLVGLGVIVSLIYYYTILPNKTAVGGISADLNRLSAYPDLTPYLLLFLVFGLTVVWYIIISLKVRTVINYRNKMWSAGR